MKSTSRAGCRRRAPAHPGGRRRGSVIPSIGKPGTGPGQFQDVRALAVDAAGRRLRGRLQPDRAHPGVRRHRDVPHRSGWSSDRDAIAALAATRDGQVLVVQSGEIARFDGATGRRLGKVGVRARGSTTWPRSRTAASWPTAGSSGTTGIVYFDRTGRGHAEVSDQVSQQMQQAVPEGHLAVDGTGRAWLLDGIRRLRRSWGSLRTGSSPTGSRPGNPGSSSSPASADIAADGAGRLLVTGRDARPVVEPRTASSCRACPWTARRGTSRWSTPTTAWVSTSAQKLVKLRLPGNDPPPSRRPGLRSAEVQPRRPARPDALRPPRKPGYSGGSGSRHRPSPGEWLGPRDTQAHDEERPRRSARSPCSLGLPVSAEIIEQVLVKVNGEIVTKTELETRQVAALRQRLRQNVSPDRHLSGTRS